MTRRFLIALVSAYALSFIGFSGVFAHDEPHGKEKMPAPKSEMHHQSSKSNSHNMGKMGRDEIPKNLDKSSSKFSSHKIFKTTLTPRKKSLSINVLQTWVLKVAYPDNHAVDNAKIIIFGGMPTHGHGFPTAPRITKNLGNGEYLIEGVQFNMPGWWEMKFQISDGRQNDTVAFNLVLPH